MIWKVTKFTFFKECWQLSREKDEYVWTGPSPARAAFTQTMGCRCGSGPGPDEENEIARVGWGVEVRWAQTGRLLWDLVAEGHCSAEEKHNNNKKQLFLNLFIWLCREQLSGWDPLLWGYWKKPLLWDLEWSFHTLPWNIGRKIKQCELLSKKHIDQEQRVHWERLQWPLACDTLSNEPKVNEGKIEW